MYNGIKQGLLISSVAAIFIGSPLFANNTQIDKVAYKSSFDDAVKIFNAGDFAKAYDKFYVLYELKSDDPQVNFYLGRAALELKKYDEATAAFERTLIVEPTHTRSRLELARAYFEQKEFVMAESELDEALKDDLPKKVRDSALAYKDAIAKSRQKHFLNGFVSLGFGYDSNTNNGIGEKEYALPSIGINLTGDAPKADRYHTEVAGINHIYDMKDVYDGLFWQDNILLYAQSYFSVTSNNARYVSLTTGPGYRTKSYEASLGLTADKLIYGNLDYMYSVGIAPKASYKATDSLILETSLSLKKKYYYYNNWARNSLYQDVGFGVRKLFASTGSVLSSNVTFSKEMENYNDGVSATGRTDVSNSTRALSINLYHPLIDGLDATAGMSVKNTFYADTDGAFSDKEKDVLYSYSAGLLKTIAKNQIVNLGVSYNKNTSNFENKIYQKRGVNVSYIYSF
ncbi:MAG: tetratricopeptide repeat protein [Campylobacterales bacterium]